MHDGPSDDTKNSISDGDRSQSNDIDRVNNPELNDKTKRVPTVYERREKTITKFLAPIRTPSREEVKTMVALALEQGILATFSHHYFTFDGKTYLEKTEGPIGLKLSGAVGKVVMLWWSRVFN